MKPQIKKVYVPLHDIDYDGWVKFTKGDGENFVKTQELYCFTREELEELLQNAFEAGEEFADSRNRYADNFTKYFNKLLND